MKILSLLLLFLFLSISLSAQPINVIAISPVDTNDRSITMDAELIRDAYNKRLEDNQRVRMISNNVSDRFFTDMQFSLNDWFDSKKTTELGDAMGVDWIVRTSYQKYGLVNIFSIYFYSVRRGIFVGGADYVVRDRFDVIDKMDNLISETMSIMQRPRSTGGNIRTLRRRVNSEIGIEVTTNSAGTLYFEDDDSITLFAGDICFIPISTSGLYEIKMVYSDGASETREVNFDAIRMTREFFYHIGGIGQAGGIVFYDKGSYSDGWRYLEVSGQNFTGVWAAYRYSVSGTSNDIGRGKSNTAMIVDELSSQNDTSKAGLRCYNLKLGNYSDWFLPSMDELQLIYDNLHLNKTGELQSRFYWSSSKAGTTSVSGINFSNGSRAASEQDQTHLFRAIRSF